MNKLVSCITGIVGGVIGFSAGAYVVGKKMTEACVELDKKRARDRACLDTMLRWMEIKHEGRSLEQYFMRENIRRIAVYDIKSFLGETFIRELRDSNNIEVVYGIGLDGGDSVDGITVYSPDDDLPQVDAVVVSLIHLFDEIKETMKTKIPFRMISLDDVVYGMKRFYQEAD